MGFYKAYRTKIEATDMARRLRTPLASTAHKYGYPAQVTVKRIKNFAGRPAWGIYIYKR